MCVFVYLTSDVEITKVPSWDGSTPAFRMDAVYDSLAGRYVYEIQSFGPSHCACGLFEKFGGPTRATSGIQRNYYALASIARDALQRGGRVQIICYWNADRGQPLVEPKVQLVPSALEAAAFAFPGRQMIEVVDRSDPENSPATLMPDRPEFKVAWGPWIFLLATAAAVGIAFGYGWTLLLGMALLSLWLFNLVTLRRLRAAWLTDLMVCAAEGNLARTRELITGGADLHARSEWGETALMYASREGRYDVVEYLLFAGADPLARADSGSSALDLARSHGHTEVAALLRRTMSL